MSEFKLMGLRNAAGEQNCFLNVVLQALWRQRACREFFYHVDQDASKKKKEDSLVESLTLLFVHYKYADGNVLPPDDVRIALAEAFIHLDRFQVGKMDDACESFEAILSAIHGGDIDKPCVDRDMCLGHRVYALDFVKEDQCEKCGFADNTNACSQFTYQLYAHELAECMPKKKPTLTNTVQASEQQKLKDCSKCSAKASIKTKNTLLSFPLICTFNVVWPSLDVDKAVHRKILGMIENSPTLQLENVFGLPENENDSFPQYHLSGIICFYPGKHYVYFGYVQDEKHWVIFDDHKYKLVGTLKNVLERCERATYLPVCLYYEQNRGHRNSIQFEDSCC